LKDRIGLFILVSFVLITSWIWLTIDTTPPWYDQADYLHTSLHYAQQLKDLNLPEFLKSVITFNRIRPPVLMLIVTPVFFQPYRNEDLAVMTNVLYLVLAFIVVYKICKSYLNSKASLLCCFVLFMYPLIFGLSRQLLPEICLLCIVSLSMLLLLKCDYFRNIKYSLLLGVSIGIGMLTKMTYAAFLIGPFIYVMYKSLTLSRKARLNLLYCLIIAIGLSAIWHGPNLKQHFSLIFSMSYGKGASWASRGTLFSADALLYYPREIMYYGISFLFSLIFLFSSTRFFIKNKDKDMKFIFLLWILTPVILFSIFLGKDVRFIIPIFVPIAIITGQGIYEIKNKIMKYALITMLVVTGFFQFMCYSFRIPMLSQLAHKSLIWNRVVFFDPLPYSCYRMLPEHAEWGVMDSLLFIKSHMERENIKESSSLLLAQQRVYNANTLLYYSDKEKFRCHIFYMGGAEDGYSMISQKYDYVIYKDKEAAYVPVYISRIKKAIKYIKANPGEFKLIYKNRLPDGSNILIYKHG